MTEAEMFEALSRDLAEMVEAGEVDPEEARDMAEWLGTVEVG
jgi:hypothetical protein